MFSSVRMNCNQKDIVIGANRISSGVTPLNVSTDCVAERVFVRREDSYLSLRNVDVAAWPSCLFCLARSLLTSCTCRISTYIIRGLLEFSCIHGPPLGSPLSQVATVISSSAYHSFLDVLQCHYTGVLL